MHLENIVICTWFNCIEIAEFKIVEDDIVLFLCSYHKDLYLELANPSKINLIWDIKQGIPLNL